MIDQGAASTIQAYVDAHARVREARDQISRVMSRLRQVDQFLDKPQEEARLLVYLGAVEPEAVRELPRWLEQLDQGLRERAELRQELERAGVLDLLQKVED